MKLDIIKTKEYLLAVDKEAEIVKGNPVVSTYTGKAELIFCNTEKQASWFQGGYGQKVVAHTPLNNAAPLEGVLSLPELKDNIEQFALKLYPIKMEWRDDCNHNEDSNGDLREGFIDGYKAAGGFSEENMKNCFQAAREFNSIDGPVDIDIVLSFNGADNSDLQAIWATPEDYIQSLKTPIAFEVEMKDIPAEELSHKTSWNTSTKVPKVVNNIIQGKYIYS